MYSPFDIGSRFLWSNVRGENRKSVTPNNIPNTRDAGGQNAIFINDWSFLSGKTGEDSDGMGSVAE